MINPMKINPFKIDICFKPLDCYDIKRNMYEISNTGMVKNIKTDRFIYPRYINSGYLSINLRCDNSKDRKKSNFLLHRLVGETFIPYDEDKNLINHKNGVKVHCQEFNLEWCNNSENVIHAMNTGLSNIRGSGNHAAKLTEEDVHKICQLIERGIKYREILETINLEITSNNLELICNIKRRKAWNHISCQYNFDNISYNHSNFTDNEIHQICKYLEDGYSFKEIYEILFNEEYIDSKYNKSFYEFIRLLKNGKTFQYISKDYNF